MGAQICADLNIPEAEADTERQVDIAAVMLSHCPGSRKEDICAKI